MKGTFARIGCALLAALACGSAMARPAAGGLALEGLPSYSHVVLLILENESFASTFGPSSAAHYLNNTLVPQGVLDDQYYATGHVSLDNYIAMTSAQPGNGLTNTDCLSASFWQCAQSTLAFSSGQNIGDQFDTAGVSWKGYMDTMPSACFHDTYSPTTTNTDPYQGNSQTPPAKDYADRHNPFIYYPDIVSDNSRCQAHDVPYTDLANDITNDTVPQYAFITPDTCHDGHDSPCSAGGPGDRTGGLTSADAWMQSEVPALLAYLSAHNGLLIITLDEGGVSDTSGCCHGGPGGAPGAGGRIGLLGLGAGVKAGQTIHTQYDHASLVRTSEDFFGISSYLNNAAQSSPMTDLFATPGTSVPEAPFALVLLALGAAAALGVRSLRKRTA